ncbi:nitrate ABC transporter substrate-binding protein [Paenibacillus sp. 598K]|uniref:ABC transporter substrate-binding protein n=1 Tax=Paenibacillus sp. 598K TaxID=1117987 RepID=UPI000FF925FC|nr:ABC transporter substrate-binding protein [Paenibacillus sp. 598K]GBF77974.1 nitrate ABC transporter substrate-binding protein [Paenibacillus sp. 598K]
MIKKTLQWGPMLAAAMALLLLLAACGGNAPSNTTGNTPSNASNNTANNTPATTTETPAEGEGETTDEALETKSLTLVGVRDAQISSQQIIADKLGYFADEGLDVTSQLIESGPDIGPMVAGGSAKVSIQTNFMDIILKSTDVPVKIIAPLAQIAGTQAVVGSADLELTSAKDLEGKTIGIPSGADVMIAINNMAAELGVDASKIKYVNLAPSDAVVALERGDIDAMASWEPFITKAIQGGGKFLFSGTKSELPDNPGDVEWMSVHTTIQVTDDFLKANPNTLKAVLRALQKATDYINDNRAEAIEILAPELRLSVEELTEIMGRNVYSMEVDASYVNGSNGPAVGEYLQSVGNITSIPDPASYHDLSLLEAVDPSLIVEPLK